MERVDFGEGITEIGINAFSSCALSRVVVPQGVTTLAGVFYNCKRLESVVLPHGLEKI